MSDENDERVLKRLTVRELRARAVKSLGSKVAAGLKLKQELVDALVARAAKVVEKVEKAAPSMARKATAKKDAEPAAQKKTEPVKKANGAAKKAEPAKKSEEAEAAPAKKSPPRRRGNGARASAPRASAPKAARGAKAAPPSPPAAIKASAPKTPAAKAAPKASAPKATAKPSKSERLAQVYELPITRDFFVDPRRQALPASYGDDRLLCFRREPLAIVVSWDLSSATFADGQGLALELVTGKGRLVGSVRIGAPTGLATFDTLPPGQALTVQVVRGGRVMTRGRPFVIGGTAQEDEGTTATQKMTVPFDQPLPKQPERRAWEDAPARTGRTEWKSTKVQAGSSRLNTETEEGAEERGARDRSGARRRASSSRFSS